LPKGIARKSKEFGSSFQKEPGGQGVASEP
jgi:hypothetical protein